jgi:hypothetical protein
MKMNSKTFLSHCGFLMFLDCQVNQGAAVLAAVTIIITQEKLSCTCTKR